MTEIVIRTALPGEHLGEAVIDHLRTGADAGMVMPDAADSELKSFRVMVE
jgi:hypothetical protein